MENYPKSKAIPLSQGQLSLWSGQRLHPNVPLYNMVHTFEIEGAINVATFQKAFQYLIYDSDALRTVFQEKDGVPHQMVHEKFPYMLDFLDFSKKERNTIEHWIKERSKLVLDLSECCFDSALLKIDNGK